ncbi:hypothetical protein ACFL56_02650 [Candidatus Margulisiibacteriota bacterium]
MKNVFLILVILFLFISITSCSNKKPPPQIETTYQQQGPTQNAFEKGSLQLLSKEYIISGVEAYIQKPVTKLIYWYAVDLSGNGLQEILTAVEADEKIYYFIFYQEKLDWLIKKVSETNDIVELTTLQTKEKRNNFFICGHVNGETIMMGLYNFKDNKLSRKFHRKANETYKAIAYNQEKEQYEITVDQDGSQHIFEVKNN